ncbi:molybdopterin-dependent oxidoreductase, partial [Wolinella succinogenes]|uniref:molybdopterin-dependent oxidoreductase n=1 Tax=Wolinella succinogenes TaxID=844 RepID=UPI002408FEEE
MSENIIQELPKLKVGRRSFLKMAALAGALGGSGALASGGVVRSATAQELKEAHPGSKKVKTICTACSVGCGIIAEVKNDVWVRQEVAQDHPVSLGGHCSKGAGMIDMIRSQKRVKYPMKKENGKWKRISWDQAIDEISAKMLEVRSKHGPDAVQFFGSAKVSNEQAYYIRKFAAFFGTNNIDHQARLCHSSTVTGVANIFGYGAMTNHLGDIQKAKSIFIMGSNPAVGHPVGFQHFLKAKEINGAKLIVVEPRFTRTAAKADHFLQIRAGTDIAFMHGMINLIVKNGWEDKKYIEDRTMGVAEVLKESAKYTPEVVADICGIKPEQLIEVTRLYAQNRPGSFVWAMGLTQHSVGTGNTRIAPILQLILGNMGKSGGGCNILRGHDNVQGASDMGCLSENLPGYFPNAEPSFKHWANVWQVDFEWLKARFAPDMMFKNGFTLARWWQGVLQEEKTYNGDSGQLKVLFNIGTGLISISQTNEVKRALDKIDLFVMIDPFPHDAIAYSDKPDGIYLLPACSQFETSGTVTATNRSGQWRYQVVNPIYESKPDHEILFAFAKKFGFYNEYV